MYTAPLTDMQFLIDDVINVAEKLGSLERFADLGVGSDLTSALLDEVKPSPPPHLLLPRAAARRRREFQGQGSPLGSYTNTHRPRHTALEVPLSRWQKLVRKPHRRPHHGLLRLQRRARRRGHRSLQWAGRLRWRRSAGRPSGASWPLPPSPGSCG